MAGAGLDPRRGLLPPFMKADIEGLDVVLERLESAAGAPRRALRAAARCCAASSPRAASGQKSGQGFYPYPQPDAEQPGGETVKLETRGDVAIAWLANGLMNSISPQVIDGPRRGLGARRGARACARWSSPPSNPLLFCAGADIKAFTADGRGRRARAHRRRPRAAARLRRARASPRSPRSTASPSAAAASWRWPATCASPRSRRCSASPRSSSGSSPASAAPSACRGSWATNKALEMNLIGDPIGADEAYEFGLVNRVVRRPRAARHRAGVGAQARRPGAAGASSAIKEVSADRRPRRRHRGREGRLRRRLRQRGRARGHRRLPGQAHSRSGADAETPGVADARGPRPRGRARSSRSPARGSRCPPGSPTSARRGPGCGRTSTRWRSRTSTRGAPTPSASGTSTATASRRSRTRSPTAPTARWSSSSAAATSTRSITQNIDMLHRKAGTRELVEVHGTHRDVVVPDLRRAATRWPRSARAWPTTRWRARAATAARR